MSKDKRSMDMSKVKTILLFTVIMVLGSVATLCTIYFYLRSNRCMGFIVNQYNYPSIVPIDSFFCKNIGKYQLFSGNWYDNIEDSRFVLDLDASLKDKSQRTADVGIIKIAEAARHLIAEKIGYNDSATGKKIHITFYGNLMSSVDDYQKSNKKVYIVRKIVSVN